MHRSGKAHWLTIVGILSVVAIGALMLFARDSAGSSAGQFMTALGKGDVDTLTKLSYIEGVPSEEVRKKWEFTTDVGKHYMFRWRIVNITQSDDKTAAATMQVTRNSAAASGYEEKFQLPLVKIGDDWKVDVTAISRGLYPALPR
ncbi:MAG TPA: DUF4878 domain-containing protein [Fimbriimonadaceae bacterium]|nr:DUF4878 domain-containing protein [Fimbriimonadaceae bacterium]